MSTPERLCQCKLTGTIELIEKGCEFCDLSKTHEVSIHNLKVALVFTKKQVEELNQKLKHPDASKI